MQEPLCSQCGDTARAVCAGCKEDFYCKAACQIQAWVVKHRAVCRGGNRFRSPLSLNERVSTGSWLILDKGLADCNALADSSAKFLTDPQSDEVLLGAGVDMANEEEHLACFKEQEDLTRLGVEAAKSDEKLQILAQLHDEGLNLLAPEESREAELVEHHENLLAQLKEEEKVLREHLNVTGPEDLAYPDHCLHEEFVDQQQVLDSEIERIQQQVGTANGEDLVQVGNGEQDLVHLEQQEDEVLQLLAPRDDEDLQDVLPGCRKHQDTGELLLMQLLGDEQVLREQLGLAGVEDRTEHEYALESRTRRHFVLGLGDEDGLLHPLKQETSLAQHKDSETHERQDLHDEDDPCRWDQQEASAQHNHSEAREQQDLDEEDDLFRWPQQETLAENHDSEVNQRQEVPAQQNDAEQEEIAQRLPPLSKIIPMDHTEESESDSGNGDLPEETQQEPEVQRLHHSQMEEAIQQSSREPESTNDSGEAAVPAQSMASQDPTPVLAEGMPSPPRAPAPASHSGSRVNRRLQAAGFAAPLPETTVKSMNPKAVGSIINRRLKAAGFSTKTEPPPAAELPSRVQQPTENMELQASTLLSESSDASSTSSKSFTAEVSQSAETISEQTDSRPLATERMSSLAKHMQASPAESPPQPQAPLASTPSKSRDPVPVHVYPFVGKLAVAARDEADPAIDVRSKPFKPCSVPEGFQKRLTPFEKPSERALTWTQLKEMSLREQSETEHTPGEDGIPSESSKVDDFGNPSKKDAPILAKLEKMEMELAASDWPGLRHDDAAAAPAPQACPSLPTLDTSEPDDSDVQTHSRPMSPSSDEIVGAKLEKMKVELMASDISERDDSTVQTHSRPMSLSSNELAGEVMLDIFAEMGAEVMRCVMDDLDIEAESAAETSEKDKEAALSTADVAAELCEGADGKMDEDLKEDSVSVLLERSEVLASDEKVQKFVAAATSTWDERVSVTTKNQDYGTFSGVPNCCTVEFIRATRRKMAKQLVQGYRNGVLTNLLRPRSDVVFAPAAATLDDLRKKVAKGLVKSYESGTLHELLSHFVVDEVGVRGKASTCLAEDHNSMKHRHPLMTGMEEYAADMAKLADAIAEIHELARSTVVAAVASAVASLDGHATRSEGKVGPQVESCKARRKAAACLQKGLNNGDLAKLLSSELQENVDKFARADTFMVIRKALACLRQGLASCDLVRILSEMQSLKKNATGDACVARRKAAACLQKGLESGELSNLLSTETQEAKQKCAAMNYRPSAMEAAMDIEASLPQYVHQDYLFCVDEVTDTMGPLMESCNSSPTNKFSRFSSPTKRAGSIASAFSPSRRAGSRRLSRASSRTASQGSRRISFGDLCSEQDAEKEAAAAAEEAAQMLAMLQELQGQEVDSQDKLFSQVESLQHSSLQGTPRRPSAESSRQVSQEASQPSRLGMSWEFPMTRDEKARRCIMLSGMEVASLRQELAEARGVDEEDSQSDDEEVHRNPMNEEIEEEVRDSASSPIDIATESSEVDSDAEDDNNAAQDSPQSSGCMDRENFSTARSSGPCFTPRDDEVARQSRRIQQLEERNRAVEDQNKQLQKGLQEMLALTNQATTEVQNSNARARALEVANEELTAQLAAAVEALHTLQAAQVSKEADDCSRSCSQVPWVDPAASAGAEAEASLDAEEAQILDQVAEADGISRSSRSSRSSVAEADFAHEAPSDPLQETVTSQRLLTRIALTVASPVITRLFRRRGIRHSC